jgi:hypothetical protein
MRRVRPVPLALLVTMAVSLAACGSDTADSTDAGNDPVSEGTAAPTGEVDTVAGPELILEGGGGQSDLTAAWAPYADAALELEEVDGPGDIPGFEPFNRGLRLPDGRILIRGRWDGDEPIGGWWQRNPASVAPGEPEPPIEEVAERPIRLFVVDPGAGSVVPVSHVPVVRPYSTAISVGEGPDVVLRFVVLDEGARVAYTAGFNGAAYDIPQVLYLAPIPPA